MPFQQPLVPSPSLSRSPVPSSSSPGSPKTTKNSSSNFAHSQPSTTSTGIGLGVLEAGQLDGSKGLSAEGKDVTSPVELTQFVDTLLNDLEARFDTLSSDVLSRLSTLSSRVDSLETSLAGLMSGTAAPNSTTPPSTSA
ncbi:heat shock factor-binding 1 family protein [Sporobolomyces salmoneus]|uniref:heat shock factor-binding 1 family protein n=1 Tax=Sporobolomyces salmoneus TaxID=183962 RepID=UPI00317BAB07